MEIWRDIVGYEGYQVSNLGRVRSFKYKTLRIMKLWLSRNGYLRIRLWRDGKPKHLLVHRLVAQAFVDNPDNKPEVNHINGNKTDNRVENLEWSTHSENQCHAFATGLSPQGEDHPDAKLTAAQVVYVRDNPDGLNTYELARMFGVTQKTISMVQRGRTYRNAGGDIREAKKVRVPDDVRAEICRLYVRSSQEFGTVALARRFGVDSSTILKIVHKN